MAARDSALNLASQPAVHLLYCWTCSPASKTEARVAYMIDVRDNSPYGALASSFVVWLAIT